ncbi:integrase [Streptomyces sp. NPDC058620]|uniref:integrase n=1 Tax=Streptomyces sp. NPDC058620 TaxID=3346560 RepID=UPI003648FC1C
MSEETTHQPQGRGMQLAELLGLPVAIDLDTANRALLIGRTKGFQLAKTGDYPVPVMRVGRTYRVSRAALLRSLGVEPEISEAAAARTATASSEPTNQTP